MKEEDKVQEEKKIYEKLGHRQDVVTIIKLIQKELDVIIQSKILIQKRVKLEITHQKEVHAWGIQLLLKFIDHKIENQEISSDIRQYRKTIWERIGNFFCHYVLIPLKQKKLKKLIIQKDLTIKKMCEILEEEEVISELMTNVEVFQELLNHLEDLSDRLASEELIWDAVRAAEMDRDPEHKKIEEDWYRAMERLEEAHASSLEREINEINSYYWHLQIPYQKFTPKPVRGQGRHHLETIQKIVYDQKYSEYIKMSFEKIILLHIDSEMRPYHETLMKYSSIYKKILSEIRYIGPAKKTDYYEDYMKKTIKRSNKRFKRKLFFKKLRFKIKSCFKIVFNKIFILLLPFIL